MNFLPPVSRPRARRRPLRGANSGGGERAGENGEISPFSRRPARAARLHWAQEGGAASACSAGPALGQQKFARLLICYCQRSLKVFPPTTGGGNNSFLGLLPERQLADQLVQPRPAERERTSEFACRVGAQSRRPVCARQPLAGRTERRFALAICARRPRVCARRRSRRRRRYRADCAN